MKVTTKILMVLTVCWMALIFVMSSQSTHQSDDLSDRFVKFIISILEPENESLAKSVKETNALAESKDFASDHTQIDTQPDDEEQQVTEHIVRPEKHWFGVPPGAFSVAVRKSAHFVMFLLLGILVCSTGISYVGKPDVMTSAMSMAICMVYALLDELHQLFVERGAEISDVLIDSFGSAVGVLVTMTVGVLIWKTKHKSQDEK